MKLSVTEICFEASCRRKQFQALLLHFDDIGCLIKSKIKINTMHIPFVYFCLTGTENV